MKKVLTLCLALLIAMSAFAQEKGGKPPSPEDMTKMMAAYEKIGAPGPEHAALAKNVGDWNVDCKFWMDPTQPPMETKGTCTDKAILGGRFIQSDFRSDMMGKPFTGMGLSGYDNFRKKYTQLWMDDMGTMMSTAEGTASPDGKVITFLGKMDDPMMGKKDKPVRYVVTWLNDKSYRFEAFDEAGTPNEFKSMEMVYTKK
jgi:hypothetical protein